MIQIHVGLCNGPKCAGVLGSFDGQTSPGAERDAFRATGGFGTITCPNGSMFVSQAATVDFVATEDNRATMTFEAIELTLSGSCGLTLHGTVVRE